MRSQAGPARTPQLSAQAGHMWAADIEVGITDLQSLGVLLEAAQLLRDALKSLSCCAPSRCEEAANHPDHCLNVHSMP